MAASTTAPPSSTSPTVTNSSSTVPLTHHSPSLEALTTTLFSPSTLLSSPYLVALTDLINVAFAGSYTIGSVEHLPKDIIRLSTPQQLVEEVGGDGFTVVVFASDASAEGGLEKRPVATASAKPWKEDAGDGAVGSETVRLFKRKPRFTTSTTSPSDSRNNIPKWEILIMAVDLAHSNRGIATTLIHTVVQEIKRRAFPASPPSSVPSIGQDQDQKIILMLTTMKENNEVYYQKRGFITTRERTFAKGMVGSRDGFSVVEMERVY